ncbi:MAG: hypothetical protein ACK4Y6_06620 [Bacteroidota bacterium]|jgi:hypothetical protein
MRTNFIIGCFVFLLVVSCQKAADTPNQNTTVQNIVSSDSSDVSGRLLVEVRNSTNTSGISNATVSLFLTYDDMLRNFALYRIASSSSGQVDFGYVLQGNYYLSGTALVSGITRTDTSVVQIIPKRTTTRFLYLK